MYTENPELYLKNRGSICNTINECQEEEKVNLNSRQVDKIIDIEIEEKEWRSCCFNMHKESSIFFGKLCISFFVLTVCSYQLITLKDCNYQALYSSILSSIVTFWLTHKKK